MNEIKIERIFIHDNRLCVKVSSGIYDNIYRSGMSASWDENLNALYYSGRETTNDNKIDIIIKAMQNEYGINLVIDKNTIIKL